MSDYKIDNWSVYNALQDKIYAEKDLAAKKNQFDMYMSLWEKSTNGNEKKALWTKMKKLADSIVVDPEKKKTK